MSNINTFEKVVHEKKIFKDLSNFSPSCPLICSLRDQRFEINKSEFPSPMDASC